MLDAGATTWWEHFNGQASRSHAWSCAPNYDLSTYVLGVKPTEPGFAAFKVEPYPCDLEWAKGVVPTVKGDIGVEWKRSEGSMEIVVNFPFEAKAEISVPARSLDATTLSGPTQAEHAKLDGGRAIYMVTKPGTYHVVSKLP